MRTLVALKVFNLLLIGVTAGAVAWYQRDGRQRWLAAFLFAANPLVLFEGIGNGHNDVLLTVFVVTAMLALQRKSPMAGPLLALSALVKLYTVALAPIFIVVAIRQGWGWKRIGLTVVLTAVAVASTCAPWWGDGKLVDGLQAGLEESQEMDHVSPLSLARQYAQEEEAAQRLDTTFALSRPSFEIVPQDIQDDYQQELHDRLRDRRVADRGNGLEGTPPGAGRRRNPAPALPADDQPLRLVPDSRVRPARTAPGPAQPLVCDDRHCPGTGVLPDVRLRSLQLGLASL